MTNYLIQVSICIGFSYLFFFLFLSREKLLNLNRLYLLGSALASFLLPFVWIPLNESGNSIWVASGEIISQLPTTPEVTGVDQSYFNLVAVIYLIGVFISLVRMTRNLYLIWLKKRRGSIKNLNGQTYIHTKDGEASSFFNLIFIPQKPQHSDDELKAIMLHERAHARAFHTADLLLFELLAAILWFNPIIYLYRRSLKLQHEFIADDIVLKTYDPDQYETLLIRHSLGQIDLSLAHAYGQAPIEKRLNMIDKLKANTMKKLKVLFISPILLLLMSVVGFSQNRSALMENLVEKAGTSEFSTQDSVPKRNVQQRPVKLNGTVFMESGEVLANATVKAIPSGNSTLTDVQGKYLLKMVDTDTLISYSKRGYKGHEVPRKRYSTVNVQLSKK